MNDLLISRVEAILRNILGEEFDLEKPRSRVETLLIALMLDSNDIRSLIDALDTRVTALEQHESDPDAEVDEDGYLVIENSNDDVDEDGYLVLTSAEIDEDDYVSFTGGGGGGDWDGGTIVITSGSLTITGDNASIENDKLIFDGAVNGVLNFESKPDPSGDDVTVEDGWVIMDGDDVSIQDDILDVNTTGSVDDDGYLNF